MTELSNERLVEMLTHHKETSAVTPEPYYRQQALDHVAALTELLERRTSQPVAFLHSPTGNVFSAKDYAILVPKWRRQFASDMTAAELAADFTPLYASPPSQREPVAVTDKMIDERLPCVGDRLHDWKKLDSGNTVCMFCGNHRPWLVDRILSALSPAPSLAVSDRWYLGSQNDGLFIINQPPRPSNDYPIHDRKDGPTLAIPLGNMAKDKAQAIVDAHNAVLSASHE